MLNGAASLKTVWQLFWKWSSVFLKKNMHSLIGEITSLIGLQSHYEAIIIWQISAVSAP